MLSKYGFETSPERSRLMSNIRAVETKPEVKLRKALWKLGIRYRKNVKSLPGKPDIVIKKALLVIFVDGEFWHGYKWKLKRTKIKSNRAYWIKKIEGNIERDRKNRKELRKLGFRVIRFWEHQVNKNLSKCLKTIMVKVKNNRNY